MTLPSFLAASKRTNSASDLLEKTTRSATHAPFSNQQVENHEDFGQGVVREKRVVEVLDKRIWDWCSLFLFFIVFALLGIITVVLVEYFTNAISDTIEGVVALAASVVGALVLTIVKFLLQVRRGRDEAISNYCDTQACTYVRRNLHCRVQPADPSRLLC